MKYFYTYFNWFDIVFVCNGIVILFCNISAEKCDWSLLANIILSSVSSKLIFFFPKASLIVSIFQHLELWSL